MKLATKLMIIVAMVYNGVLGYYVKFTADPYLVLFLLSVDFFLIFYYLWLLIRENLGVMKFEMENKDLIEKARKEVRSMK